MEGLLLILIILIAWVASCLIEKSFEIFYSFFITSFKTAKNTISKYTTNKVIHKKVYMK